MDKGKNKEGKDNDQLSTEEQMVEKQQVQTERPYGTYVTSGYAGSKAKDSDDQDYTHLQCYTDHTFW